MKLSFSVFGRTFVLRSNIYKKPTLEVQGYTSRCEDGKHVLFLDWDGVSPEIVMKDLEELSAVCSHFFVFTTKEEKDELGVYGNYHAVCTDKYYFSEIIELQKMTHTDEMHKTMVKHTRYRAWVLRLFEKGERAAPKFLKFIKTDVEYEDREQSLAHIKLLSMLDPKIKKQLKYELMATDDNTNIKITHYTTAWESKK